VCAEDARRKKKNDNFSRRKTRGPDIFGAHYLVHPPFGANRAQGSGIRSSFEWGPARGEAKWDPAGKSRGPGGIPPETEAVCRHRLGLEMLTAETVKFF